MTRKVRITKVGSLWHLKTEDDTTVANSTDWKVVIDYVTKMTPEEFKRLVMINGDRDPQFGILGQDWLWTSAPTEGQIDDNPLNLDVVWKVAS